MATVELPCQSGHLPTQPNLASDPLGKYYLRASEGMSGVCCMIQISVCVATTAATHVDVKAGVKQGPSMTSFGSLIRLKSISSWQMHWPHRRCVSPLGG